MISLYSAALDGAEPRLVRADGAGDVIPDHVVWIDLVRPTREEERLVERHLGIGVPTIEEQKDIEPSELLYIEDGARYMTARVICHMQSSYPKLAPVSFILTARGLVTVRYDEPNSFVLFANRASKLTDSYMRYLEKVIRDEWNAPGVPFKMSVRGKGPKNPK